MGIKLQYPLKNSSTVMSEMKMQPGKNKVPFRLELAAETYSNDAIKRANGGDELLKLILPPPTEGMNNSVAHAYNQSPAKEEAILTKLVSGKATEIMRDALNFFGKQYEDAVTMVTGMDYGRIPADMSESTYSGSDKRSWTFMWDLVSLNATDSAMIIRISNYLTSYSLPGATNSADRAVAPALWRIKVLNDNGQSSKNITRALLGSPKACVLTSCQISRDMSALYAAKGQAKYASPLSVQLKLHFQEIEPVYGQDGNIRSRSEIRIGGGIWNIDSE